MNYNKLDHLYQIHTQENIDQHLDGVRNILSIPLTLGKNWLGNLLLGSKNDAYEFKVSTINQISTLASQAAVVIQNLQLVEDTQQNLYNSEILSSLGQQLLKAEIKQ